MGLGKIKNNSSILGKSLHPFCNTLVSIWLLPTRQLLLLPLPFGRLGLPGLEAPVAQNACLPEPGGGVPLHMVPFTGVQEV